MHSSTLRDGDFSIVAGGAATPLADYFNGHTNTKRLGLLTPDRTGGTGAIALVMAHVTAFYNAYRASGEDFFAYPDYYTFQSQKPLAAYGQFDIWPDHKSVLVSDDPLERLNAITDRAVNILLVPEVAPAEPFAKWIRSVYDSVGTDAPDLRGDGLEQSFRRIGLEDALNLL